MQPHISRVYIDSRHLLENGDYELPDGGVELPIGSKCWLGEFTCVASWDTINDYNYILYVVENGTHLRTCELTTGPHDMDSLREILELQLNGVGKDPAMGTYSVIRTSTGTGGGTYRAFRITCSAGLFILPDEREIRTRWGVSPSHYVPTTNSWMTFPDGAIADDTHDSGFVDLRPIHSLYLHSPSFGNYNAIGPRGERTILAKVPVSVGYGQLVTWTSPANDHDYIQAGTRSLKILRIELKDAYGRPIDLKGTHWSATLIFGQ
jgi:hypothetical protein